MSKEMLDGKRVKNIRLIPYSHNDYAWVCTRNWHKLRYIKCFSEVIEKVRENPDFTWHIDNVIHSWLPFIENCPEKVAEFKKYVSQGRIVVLNGGYSLARPSYVGEESYIRNMTVGKKYFEEFFGIDGISVLLNADTACGHSQVPQIAKLCGHKYYHFLRPGVSLTSKGVPFQFIWRGLDGSELLTSRGWDGSLWTNNDFLNNDYETQWEETKSAYFDFWLSDKVMENLPVETVVLFLGADDNRPLMDMHDKPLKIGEFMEEWNRREKTKMSYARFPDVFDELAKSDLPVFEGVLDHAELAYNFPFKGNKSLWRMRIILDRMIVLCEKLCVIAQTTGFEYPQKEIDALWLDLFEITGHAMEFIQAQNAVEIFNIAEKARLQAVALAEKASEHITANVSRESEIQAVLINTNAWEVEQAVQLEVTSYHGISGFDVMDAYGNKLEYQLLDWQNGYCVYECADHTIVDILVRAKVPAFGYTSLKIMENGTSLKSLTEEKFIDLLPAYFPQDCKDEVRFDNGALEVIFDKGQLISLTNIKTGKTVKNPAKGLKFIEFPPAASWLTVYSEINTHDFTPEHCKILENGPIRYVYAVCGKIAGQKASLTYSLDIGSMGLDVEVKTEFEDSIEGMLVFSAKADSDAEIYADIPFGTEKREFFDNLPADDELAFSGQVYGRNWCSFSAEGNPVAIVTQNCSIYYIYRKEAQEMQLVLNRSMPLKTRTDRWAGKMPEETNGTGKNDYNFSLIFAEKLGQSYDIHKYHRNRAFPACARLKLDTGKTKAKAHDSLVKADNDNIINTAAYNCGGRTIARFFECDGQKTQCRISLPFDTQSVRAVDFEGNEMPDVKASFDAAKKEVVVDFEPYKIVTLELTRNF